MAASLWSLIRSWDWNFEAVGQFGSFAGRSIWAWTLASDTGYTFSSLPWAPRLGLQADIASGSNGSHGTLGTFNPLFPKLPYFTEASLIVPSNFVDVHPSLTVHPTASVAVTVGWDVLWRASIHDAVYGAPAPPLVAVPGTANTTGRSIGNQASLDVTWRFDRHLTFNGSYVHFNAGSAITEAGGKDVDFFMTSATYRF